MSSPARTRILRAALGGLLVLSFAACAGGASDGDADADASFPAAASPAGGALGTVPPGGAVMGVSANTATVEEIADALAAAGVDNAEKWANEVEEYRPYADADELKSKLNRELAKYDPGQETIDRIVGALVP